MIDEVRLWERDRTHPSSLGLATDYWIVKRRSLDVPSLYRCHGRYRYNSGINPRAVVAFLISVTPNLLGLAKAVIPSLNIGSGIHHIWEMNYLWGFTSAALVYWSPNQIWPATETLLDAPITEDIKIFNGVEIVNDGVHDPLTSEKAKQANIVATQDI